MAPIRGLTGLGGGAVIPLPSLPETQFTSLSWYVTNAVDPDYSIRGFTVAIWHSTHTNNVIFPSTFTRTTVYADTSTTEFTAAESTGELNIPFGGGDNSAVSKSNSWTWNGYRDIIIEVCTSQNQTNYSSTGAMRFQYLPSGSRSFQTYSSGNSCGLTPTTSSSFSFATKLFSSDGYYYEPNWDSPYTTTVTNPSPINVYYRRIVMRYIIQEKDMRKYLVR